MASLQVGICGLVELYELQIQGCPKLREIPEAVKDLKLTVYDCDDLVSLPVGFGRVVELQELDIRSCPKLRENPREFQGPQVFTKAKFF